MDGSDSRKYLEEFLELWRLTDFAYTALLKRWNLSFNAYLVLVLLHRNPVGVEPAVIAESVNIMRQMVTIILNEFESKKMIVRKALTTDHRRKRILLSPVGRKFADEVITAVSSIELESISQMNIEEQKLLLDMTARYCRIIQEAAGRN